MFSSATSIFYLFHQWYFAKIVLDDTEIYLLLLRCPYAALCCPNLWHRRWWFILPSPWISSSFWFTLKGWRRHELRNFHFIISSFWKIQFFSKSITIRFKKIRQEIFWYIFILVFTSDLKWLLNHFKIYTYLKKNPKNNYLFGMTIFKIKHNFQF